MAFHPKLDYEIASGFGDIEYSDSGFVASIDGRSVHTPVFRKSASRYESKTLDGFSCLYNKPHVYKNNIEVFDPGCFNKTLSSKQRVDFCVDHKEYSLGNTDDNLELVDTKTGLAFRLRVKSEADLNRLDGRNSMSVKYAEHEVEFRRVADCDVRFIKSATLIECSAVFNGAVPKTHLIVRDTKGVGCLRDDSESGFACDGAFVALRRALEKLDAS
jgi:HK97 family phage prohead protease